MTCLCPRHGAPWYRHQPDCRFYQEGAALVSTIQAGRTIPPELRSAVAVLDIAPGATVRILSRGMVTLLLAAGFQVTDLDFDPALNNRRTITANRGCGDIEVLWTEQGYWIRGPVTERTAAAAFLDPILAELGVRKAEPTGPYVRTGGLSDASS